MTGFRVTLLITLCLVLCQSARHADRYSIARASQGSSIDERQRGRNLLSAVLTAPDIPEYRINSDLTDIRGSSTTYLRNFEFSNLQTGNSARFTKLDDITAELVTSDLSLNIRADFEIRVSSLFLNVHDTGTFSYQLDPARLNIVYSYNVGPPGNLEQTRCTGDIEFSHPTLTADRGDSWMYTIVLNSISDDIQEEVTTEICALFDPKVNDVAALSLQANVDMFEIKCPPVPHAIFAGCARTPNSACAVACEDGYVTSSALVLNSIVICMRGGFWNVPEDSVCEVASCENSAESCIGEGEICVDDTPSGFHCECQQSYVRNSGDTGCIVLEERLQFVVRPGDVTVDKGDQAELLCEVNTDEASLYWYKGTRQLLSRDLEDGVYVSRNMVTFPRTETKHGGKYTCVARLPGGTEIRATALLSIASPDITSPATVFEPVFIRRPEDTELTLGHVAQFHCGVDIANAEVNWFKDDIETTVGGKSQGFIKLLDNSLVIVNTEIHHQGTYRCVVTSPDGRTAEATARAYFPTSYVFDSVPSDGTVFDGEVYHLTCALRIATLTLSWLKDGAPLIYSERIFKLGGDVLLRDVTANDKGQYACVASDSEGHTVAQAVATVAVVTHNLNDFDCGIVTSSEVLDGQDAARSSAPWIARLYINGLGVGGVTFVVVPS
ncbi:uncharacterized protein [Apostichopus japonicus]|uniref:uncharacterized protein isoform X2 n=1 Tax=Stichopus japonicus TaxID=307972 RepID=UPI003AB3DBB6